MRTRFDDVTLEADGFVLRPLREGDIPDVATACQDPVTQRWLPLPRPYTEGDAREFVTQAAPALLASGDGIVRAIDVDGRLHGVVDLKHTVWRYAETEIGYWIAPWGRGRGLSGRASRVLADWALTEQDIERVNLVAATHNIASQVAALAAGFVREGMKRSGGVTHDGRVDVAIFGKIRSDVGES